MKVLLIILILLALLLLLRVGVIAEYSEAGAEVALKVVPFSFRIIPGREKSVKEKKEKKKIKKKKNKDKEKAKRGGSFDMFMELVPQALDMLGAFRRKLLIKDLRIHFVSAADSPYSAAMNFGYASAAVGMVLPLIENAFNLKHRDITTDVSFTDKSSTIYLKADISILIYQVLYITLAYGFGMLNTYIKFNRRNKHRKAE